MRTLIVILCVLSFLSPSYATRSITLATGEWAPYTSENMEHFGFITEILTNVLMEMGYTPDYLFYPWRRCYISTVEGDIMGAFPYAFTEERADEVLYSDPIFDSLSKFFYCRKPISARFSNLNDLKPYRIGGVLGYFYETSFKKAGLNVTYYAEEQTALLHLERGVIDLLPLNVLVGWKLINENYPDQSHRFGTLDPSFSKEPLHLIVSKHRKDASTFLKTFNSKLESFKASEKYSTLLKKYQLTGTEEAITIYNKN